MGVVNLSYRGQKYHLKEGVVSFNLDENPGVRAPKQYVDGVIQLNLDQEPEVEPMTDQGEIEEHIVGLIMSNQYSLKRGWNCLERRPKQQPRRNCSRSTIWPPTHLD